MEQEVGGSSPPNCTTRQSDLAAVIEASSVLSTTVVLHTHRYAARAVDRVGTDVSNAPTETASTGVTLGGPNGSEASLGCYLCG